MGKFFWTTARIDELRRLNAAEPAALASRLAKCGLKMGHRQRLLGALR